MPIRGLTETTRITRAGKIRMGVRKANANGQGDHPKSVDHFVCPPEVLEHLTPDRVAYCAGECGETPGPIELPIMFPVDDVERIASQNYRAYKRAGLVCKGDGFTASGRLVPALEGITVEHHPKTSEAWSAEGKWYDFKCLGEGYDDAPPCPLYLVKGGCRKMMILQFMILDVSGLDVWQFDTGSINSILNINSALNVLKSIRGGVAGVPLVLRTEKYEMNVNGKRTTVNAVRLSYEVTPRELLELPRPEAQAQLAAPADDEPDDAIDGEAHEVETTADATELEEQRQRDCREVVALITEGWNAGDEAERKQLAETLVKRWPQYLTKDGNLSASRLPGPVAKEVLTYLRAAVRGEAADPDAVGTVADE